MSPYKSSGTTIWARIENGSNGNCYDIISFDIVVTPTPRAIRPLDLQQCDDDADGQMIFDLEVQTPIILDGQVTMNITYYDDEVNANDKKGWILDTTVYMSGTRTIWARVEPVSVVGCYLLTSFDIEVLDSPVANLPTNIQVCDDNNDGFYSFDFNAMKDAEILGNQNPATYSISYFETQANADASINALTNPISNPLNFTNTLANQQTIYVRVINSNPNNTTCFSDTYFDIVVEPLPNALLVPFDFIQCDEDSMPDGIVDFNLAQADTFLSLGNTSLNVTYHLTPIDAAAGINTQNKSSFSNATYSQLYGRVEGVNGCYRIVPVNLMVSLNAFPPGYSRELIECDDDAVIDGLHVFNLAQTTSEIISLFPSQNLRVSYYRNQNDALSESDKIYPTDVYLSEVANNQTIWVRVESSVDGGCFGIAPVIELTVNPRPEFELDEKGIVCLNDLPLIVSTYNPNDIYIYEWTDEQGNVISQQPFAEFTQSGVYTVIATSNLGCQSFPQTITITESNIASLDQEDIIVNDNSSNNSISVITDNQNLGVGDYEFALNDSFGSYQDNPTFLNLIPGEYIVYVRDKNNCGIAQVTVYVLGFPNFFTPNNDNENDTWQVRGVDQSVFPQSSIEIYDRYGRLLSMFDANDIGWDGTYANVEVISSDYWYVVQLVDIEGVERKYRGHFSLLRK